MRAFILALVIAGAGIAAASPAFDDVRVASACSCGDCNFVSDSAFVVRGTFVAWDYVRDSAGNPVEREIEGSRYPLPGALPRERPIELEVAVTAVFKGSMPGRIVVSESLYDRYLRAEGSPPFGDWEWPEPAGVCFGLGSDPSGEDTLMILQPATEPGQYRLVVGPMPYTPETARAFAERYPLLGGPYPPAAGNSPAMATGTGDDPNDWVFVSAIGAGVVLFTLVALMVGPRRDRKP